MAVLEDNDLILKSTLHQADSIKRGSVIMLITLDPQAVTDNDLVVIQNTETGFQKIDLISSKYLIKLNFIYCFTLKPEQESSFEG